VTTTREEEEIPEKERSDPHRHPRPPPAFIFLAPGTEPHRPSGRTQCNAGRRSRQADTYLRPNKIPKPIPVTRRRPTTASGPRGGGRRFREPPAARTAPAPAQRSAAHAGCLASRTRIFPQGSVAVSPSDAPRTPVHMLFLFFLFFFLMPAGRSIDGFSPAVMWYCNRQSPESDGRSDQTRRQPRPEVSIRSRLGSSYLLGLLIASRRLETACELPRDDLLMTVCHRLSNWKTRKVKASE
jgi:hypothetical protein